MPQSPPSSTTGLHEHDLHDLRREYRRGELLESQALGDPIEQFAAWFEEARRAGELEPNAMTLATADHAGVPSARIVLLKEFDGRGFVFYTNYDSRKGGQLADNPRAALVFFWGKLERQARIEGRVAKVSRAESLAYFQERPRLSRIATWVSQQSRPIGSRDELRERDAQLIARFGEGDIPMPRHWGGYRVIPNRIEFWQGRQGRLHDRLEYRRRSGKWSIQRLQP